MKKIFSVLLFVILTSFTGKNSSINYLLSNGKEFYQDLYQKKLIVIPIDMTITSTNGCTFHIVGNLSVTVRIPVRNSTINGFVGTVTVSGGSGCPNGTYTFNWTNPQEPLKRSEEEIIVEFDTEILCDLKLIEWESGNTDIDYVLNQQEVNNDLVQKMKNEFGECE